MKRCCLIGFLVLFSVNSWFSCEGFAEKIDLLWTGLRLDESVFLQFAGKDAKTVLDLLRNEYGLHVVFLREAPSLGAVNESGDGELRLQLEKIFLEIPKVGAMMFPPHRHVLCYKSETLPWSSEESLIVIRKPELRLLRMILIHEFLHYFLYTKREEKCRVLDGELHEIFCGNNYELAQLEKRLNDQLRLAGGKSVSEKDIAEWNGLARLFFDFLEKTYRVNEEILGEEIDIHRLTYEYRRELGLSREEIQFIMHRIRSYMEKLDVLLQNESFSNIASFLKLESFADQYAEDVREQFLKVAEQKGALGKKYEETLSWMSESMKTP
ncbi:MAG: hypothetical protein HY391_03215 [Deltaproteobacteria bacterium]|nr:hypothetical protein [Deltaproteobacteria bacterium]